MSRIVWLGRRMRSWLPASRAPRRRTAVDDAIDAQRAQAAAEMEAHDTEDMLDAIVAYRRARGRCDIGDELARELLGEADRD